MTDDVEYLDATPLVVIIVGNERRERVDPRIIIRARDQFLVEPTDDPDNWCMGAMIDGEIVCWGQYGPLEDALRSL